MDTLLHILHKRLARYRVSGTFSILYALGIEALTLGLVFFLGLFAIETLLPTFVTLRFSLTKFFFVLIVAALILIALGRYLELSFSMKLSWKSPLLWLGLLYTVGILAVSLFKFPLPLIPVLIVGLLIVCYLFWDIFFHEKN